MLELSANDSIIKAYLKDLQHLRTRQRIRVAISMVGESPHAETREGGPRSVES